MKGVALLLCLIAVAGCNSARSIERDGDFRGHSLVQTRLNVPRNFVVKQVGYKRLTVISGEYEPIQQDDGGVYFRSPGGVLVDDTFLTGGIYVKTAAGTPAQVWCEKPSGLNQLIAVLPPECKYEIVRR